MNRNRDILEDLARANPARNEDLPDTTLEQEGRLLLERIRARRTGTVATTPRRVPARAIGWATAAAVILLTAILVPLLTLGGESAQKASADQQAGVTGMQAPGAHTSVSSTAVPGGLETVPRSVALAGIVQLARELQIAGPPLVAGASASGDLATEALAMNVLLPAEGPDFKLSAVTTRAQYALWLWRAFGSHLSPKTGVWLTDLGSLTEEEQQAVKGIAAAGILEGAGSTFNGDAHLSPAAEEAMLQRVRQTIQNPHPIG